MNMFAPTSAMYAPLTNDIITYIYKLIHRDIVLNLNREYLDLVTVSNLDLLSKNKDVVIQCRLYVNLTHPSCKIKSNRTFFYFNYRNLAIPDSRIFNIHRLSKMRLENY